MRPDKSVNAGGAIPHGQYRQCRRLNISLWRGHGEPRPPLIPPPAASNRVRHGRSKHQTSGVHHQYWACKRRRCEDAAGTAASLQHAAFSEQCALIGPIAPATGSRPHRGQNKRPAAQAIGAKSVQSPGTFHCFGGPGTDDFRDSVKAGKSSRSLTSATARILSRPIA